MTDPRGDLPDELRRVLQRAPAARSARDADDLLARVRVGARRRRARRAVTVGAVGLAAAATVFAVASPFGDRGADAPIAAHTPEDAGEEPTGVTTLSVPTDPGKPVEPTDVRVRSIGAASIENYWVLADASCPTGECSVVGRTDDAAATPLEFSTAPGLTGADAKVRISGTGEEGWVVSTGQLFATRDAAESWRPVSTPMETVDDVVTSAGSVWVTGRSRDLSSIVVATGAADDDFREVDLPAELEKSPMLSDTVLTASDQGRLFGFMRAGDPYAEFVAYDEVAKSWESYQTGECKDAPSLSATETVLWAICTRAEDSVPMVSTDGGQTWEVVEVSGLGDDPRIAAVDGETAFISTGYGLYVLNGDRLDYADPGPEGAGMKTYEEMVFIGQTGFILDTDGVLSRSDNGGTSWAPVELP